MEQIKAGGTEPRLMGAADYADLDRRIAAADAVKRCRARQGSARCELPAGHAGLHNSHFGDF